MIPLKEGADADKKSVPRAGGDDPDKIKSLRVTN